PSQIYTLSLHDALPISNAGNEFLVMESEREAKQLSDERLEAKRATKLFVPQRATLETLLETAGGQKVLRIVLKCDTQGSLEALRSEEHTSELQSRSDLV